MVKNCCEKPLQHGALHPLHSKVYCTQEMLHYVPRLSASCFPIWPPVVQYPADPPPLDSASSTTLLGTHEAEAHVHTRMHLIIPPLFHYPLQQGQPPVDKLIESGIHE